MMYKGLMNTMPIRNGIAAEFIKKLNTSKTFTDQATVLVTLQPYIQQHSGFCMSLLCKTDNFNSFLSQTWGPPPHPELQWLHCPLQQHSGESFMSLSQQTDGHHSNGCNSFPVPAQGLSEADDSISS